jgi:peroxiredoxin Q/BCP
MLKEGDAAPAFDLPDEENRKVKLKDFTGQAVVLYFFPKADTPGWTIEASGFRDAIADFKKLKAQILGVSPDTPSDQKKFKDKYSLPFPLLADADHTLAEAYGVWKEKSMYGKTFMGIERSTFVIDASGKIKKIFPKVKVEGHTEEVLAALKQ